MKILCSDNLDSLLKIEHQAVFADAEAITKSAEEPFEKTKNNQTALEFKKNRAHETIWWLPFEVQNLENPQSQACRMSAQYAWFLHRAWPKAFQSNLSRPIKAVLGNDLLGNDVTAEDAQKIKASKKDETDRPSLLWASEGCKKPLLFLARPCRKVDIYSSNFWSFFIESSLALNKQRFFLLAEDFWRTSNQAERKTCLEAFQSSLVQFNQKNENFELVFVLEQAFEMFQMWQNFTNQHPIEYFSNRSINEINQTAHIKQ